MQSHCLLDMLNMLLRASFALCLVLNQHLSVVYVVFQQIADLGLSFLAHPFALPLLPSPYRSLLALVGAATLPISMALDLCERFFARTQRSASRRALLPR